MEKNEFVTKTDFGKRMEKSEGRIQYTEEKLEKLRLSV